MRIVGGKFAGRDLTSPGNSRVRPTAEHVRGALLDHLRAEVDGARVLDLFAGTGALGIEALSRGARSADFVEMNPASLHALKANVARFRLKERSRIFVKDAIHFADALPPGRYDLCLADPPYESKQLDWLIRIWAERRFARTLAVEHAASHALPRGQAQLAFDTTRVTIYRLVEGGTDG
jgi:16S rRNA (guanine966-N2)-methyltransferase